jgi:hypothetical protein
VFTKKGESRWWRIIRYFEISLYISSRSIITPNLLFSIFIYFYYYRNLYHSKATNFEMKVAEAHTHKSTDTTHLIQE